MAGIVQTSHLSSPRLCLMSLELATNLGETLVHFVFSLFAAANVSSEDCCPLDAHRSLQHCARLDDWR